MELEQELEVMMGELSAAQQAAKQAPSRTMKTLVERLRNQLAMKEKQHRVSWRKEEEEWRREGGWGWRGKEMGGRGMEEGEEGRD